MRTLAYAGFAAQFEEIQADIAGFNAGIRIKAAVNDLLKPNWSMAAAVAIMARGQPVDIFERVNEERVLVPDALQELYRQHPRLDEVALPQEWASTPAWLRPIMARLLLRDEAYPYRQVGGADEEARSPKAGSETISSGIKDAIRLAETGQKTTRLESLRRLTKSFPAHPLVRLELAIALDELGSPAAAWPEIRDGLLLAPRQTITWRSLGVILERLGHRDDAMIAAAIAEAIAAKPE